MAEESSTLFSPDLPAFGKHLFLLVRDGSASLELYRHRVGLLRNRRGKFGLASIVAQPDRTGGNRKHRNAGCHTERQRFECIGVAH
jgi:hypothetical protein